MEDLITELIEILLTEATDKSPGTIWRTKGGNWRAMNKIGNVKSFQDEQAAQTYAKGRSKDSDKTSVKSKKGGSTDKETEKKAKPKKLTPDKISLSVRDSSLSKGLKVPGMMGAFDSIKGITTEGEVGLGTPESRASEASVVVIANSLLVDRKKFSGDMATFLSIKNSEIDDMLSYLSNLPDSKLKKDWLGATKNQIVTSLVEVEKKYGIISSVVWDNVDGRSSMGLGKKSDEDRSDFYAKTDAGVIGISLKKSGKVFLANNGYVKVMDKISSFAATPKAKEALDKLKNLHKDTSNKAAKDIFNYIKANSDVIKALKKLNREDISDVESPKYDKYFVDGKLGPEFLTKIYEGEKLKSEEAKLLFKSLPKTDLEKIKQLVTKLRSVDNIVTTNLLSMMNSNSDIKRATTDFLINALDIPQMITPNSFEGIKDVVTVYGEVSTASGKRPMYVDGALIRETFGIDKNMSPEDAVETIRNRFIIDAGDDTGRGYIRLRITNTTPPPEYYYPVVCYATVRTRGLGAAAALEMYQEDSWTHTLSSKSPNPDEWDAGNKKKHAKDTAKFLSRLMKDPALTDKQRQQFKKDIEFYKQIG